MFVLMNNDSMFSCFLIENIYLCLLPVFFLTEMQPEYFHDPDKKTIHFQPDLTQGVVVGSNYEYPHHAHVVTTSGQNITMALPRSVSEHHYDVPHLTTKWVLVTSNIFMIAPIIFMITATI